MQGDEKQDRNPHSAEFAIEQFRKSAEHTIGAWTDDKLDDVIARLRRDSARRPNNFALLMFLEDALLRRHELRSFTDATRDFPREAFPDA